MAYTTQAKTIIDMAATALDDVAKVNWTEGELLWWLNLSQIEMVNLAPFTNVKNLVYRLAPGVKQNLPVDGFLLLDVPYNYVSYGTRVGAAIIEVPKNIMNKRIPGWTVAAANPVVQRYVYNREDPAVFYVYPPQPALTTYVELAYAAVPTTILNAAVGTKITVDDQYQNVLLNLVLAKAFSKDSEYGNNAEKAREYRALAELELGLAKAAKQAQDSEAEQAQQ